MADTQVMTSLSLTTALQQVDGLIEAQQWSEARPLADALMQQAPTTPGVIERLMLVLRNLEDWAALTALLMDARNRYQLWPQGSDLLMGQGMVELGHWSQAVPYLELALQQEGSTGWAHHFLGKALRHSGRLKEALGHQQQATELLPDFAWAPFEAAQLFVELGRDSQAVLELQEARRRHGDANPVMDEQWNKMRPLVLLQQVEQLQAAGQISEAFVMLRQAMTQIPGDAALEAKLSELLLQSNALPAAAAGGDAEAPGDAADLPVLELELNTIEALLDELEARAQQPAPPPTNPLPVVADGEVSYL